MKERHWIGHGWAAQLVAVGDIIAYEPTGQVYQVKSWFCIATTWYVASERRHPDGEWVSTSLQSTACRLATPAEKHGFLLAESGNGHGPV